LARTSTIEKIRNGTLRRKIRKNRNEKIRNETIMRKMELRKILYKK
jgi:hypothetical protein